MGFLSDMILGSKKPSMLDKIDMLFTDVDTEGRKQGYQRASSEYKEKFWKVEQEYKRITDLIEAQRESHGETARRLMEQLAKLERQKEELTSKVARKTNEVADEYNVSAEQIRKALQGGSSIFENTYNFPGILDVVYGYKEKKLREAEQEGYLEAKALYDEKLKKMRADLKRLEEKGNSEIRRLIRLNAEVLNEIAQVQMQIAELDILLGA